MKGDGWLTDPALVNRLVGEKLEALAAAIREQGWKFVEAMPEQDWREEQKNGRIHPSYGDPSPESQQEAATLQAEADAIMAEHGEEPEDGDIYERLEEIQGRITEIERGDPVWTPEQKAIAGVVITIGHNGEPSIKYGIVKPEDKAAMKKLVGTGNGREPADPTKPKEKAGLSAALTAELTSHKNAAAAVMLAEQPRVALIAVTHALAVSVFYTYGNSSHRSLGISGAATTYPMAISDTIKKSDAGKKLAGLVTAWKRKIPSKPELLWAWLEKQKPETVQGLLAICAALTVDIVQSNGPKAKRTDGELVKSLKLNMAEWWEATATTYFSRVAKTEAVRAVTQACGKPAASDLASMNKANMAAAAERRIKGKKWLPEALRP